MVTSPTPFHLDQKVSLQNGKLGALNSLIADTVICTTRHWGQDR